MKRKLKFYLRAYMRECIKFLVVSNDTEQLQTDAGSYDEQAHGEQDQAAQFFARTKDLEARIAKFKIKL